MKHFKSLAELHQFNNYPAPEHPLLSLMHCKEGCPFGETEFTGDFYMIAMKKMKTGVIMYGRTKYDNESGSMYFSKPRQVLQIQDMTLEEKGFAIYIHEDYLNGHPLHDVIKKYSYFEYETNEALHLSPKEEETIWELYSKIETEYNNNPDEYSKDIILAHIDSILKYSQRFYKRQFINRKELSGRMVTKFNELLSSHLEKNKIQDTGLPTVKDLAAQLHTSPRYLSDTLKQETGKTALDLIHIYLITEAKNQLRLSDHNVAEVAYSLGFENLPYFSRLFKKEVGVSPNQFKKQYLN